MSSASASSCIENRGTPYEVLLGRLGVDALEQQGRDWFSFPKASPTTPHYFPETGHAIGAQFWDYWRTHGLEFGDRGVTFRESLALSGYPISEPEVEVNSSGDSVQTQWFERARIRNITPATPTRIRCCWRGLAPRPPGSTPPARPC